MALLMLTGLFLMSFMPKHTIAQIRPMCLSQFALANQACAVLPTTEGPRDLNATQLQVAVDNDDDDGGGDEDVNEREHRHGRLGSGNGNGSDHSQRRGNETGHRQAHGNGNGNGHRQSHGNRNGNGHRQSHGNGNGNGHRQRREYGHNHSQRHEDGHGHGGDHRDEPRANKDCCRWLEEVDLPCVCGVLHSLPPFLVKLDHRYSIKVGNTCSRTFHCYGV